MARSHTHFPFWKRWLYRLVKSVDVEKALRAMYRRGIRKGYTDAMRKVRDAQLEPVYVVGEYCTKHDPPVRMEEVQRGQYVCVCCQEGQRTEPLPRYHPFPAKRYLLHKQYEVARMDTQHIPSIEKKTMRAVQLQAMQQERRHV